ncbi:MAG: outer membrane lipopolysaccharide assembly protein LptE/RlpB [Gammaproteobacteria bacterium]|jgi:outer membrane lipopolysaccharide assembly protein LptE/RlpB
MMALQQTLTIRFLGAAMLLVLLQGCGFKLCNPCQGDDLSSQLGSVTYYPNVPEQGMAQALRQSLFERRIGLTSGQVLELSSVSEQVALLSSNANGTPLEYQLSISGSYRSYPPETEALPAWKSFTAQRSYLFNGANLLSNQDEEQILREDIYQRMINVILRHTALQTVSQQ